MPGVWTMSEVRFPPVEGPLYDDSVSFLKMVERIKKGGGTRGQKTSRMIVARDALERLEKDRDEMAKTLTKQDEWFGRNESHRKRTEREGQYLVQLQEYEHACDALRASEGVISR